jgi:hypothetical protein
VWGDGFYTDDSSVCTAAVHAGVLTGGPGSPIRTDASNGGWTISLVVRPGEDAYAGVTRNGVTSKPWDVWEGSFEFVTR